MKNFINNFYQIIILDLNNLMTKMTERIFLSAMLNSESITIKVNQMPSERDWREYLNIENKTKKLQLFNQTEQQSDDYFRINFLNTWDNHFRPVFKIYLFGCFLMLLLLISWLLIQYMKFIEVIELLSLMLKVWRLLIALRVIKNALDSLHFGLEFT